MIIVFSGIDGSGKTTLAKKMVQELKKAGKKAVYVHGYEFSFTHKLLRRWRSRLVSQKTVQCHDQCGSKPFLLHLWVYWFFFDFSMKVLLTKIFFPRKIFVFDRYLHDYLISCSYQGYRLPLRLFLWLMPRPHKAFWISAPLSFIAQHRSDEHEEQYFQDIGEFYKRFLPSFFVTFENGVYPPLDSVRRLIELCGFDED